MQTLKTRVKRAIEVENSEVSLVIAPLKYWALLQGIIHPPKDVLDMH
jgi:hypothetical protein